MRGFAWTWTLALSATATWSATAAYAETAPEPTPVVPLVDPGFRLDDQWPAPPPDLDEPLDQHMLDRVSEISNRAVRNVDMLSHQTVAVRIDARGQRAHLRFAAGSDHYLRFRMDEDIHIGDGEARIASRMDLTLHGRNLHIDVPDVEMLPDEYEGSHYVEVRVPLFERRW